MCDIFCHLYMALTKNSQKKPGDARGILPGLRQKASYFFTFSSTLSKPLLILFVRYFSLFAAGQRYTTPVPE